MEIRKLNTEGAGRFTHDMADEKHVAEVLKEYNMSGKDYYGPNQMIPGGMFPTVAHAILRSEFFVWSC